MFPSARIIRFFIVYGILLFLLDHFVMNPDRGWKESLIFVAVADIIAILLYPLFKKGYQKLTGSNQDNS